MSLSESYIRRIAAELKLDAKQVYTTATLLNEGGTVPFIARYRKEATGMLDEVQITNIRDRLTQLGELDARRQSILKSLDERNLLTDELKKSIAAAETLTRLEDIYQPYRPKRRTRATIAKEAGLEPLADLLWQQPASLDPQQEATAFCQLEIETAEGKKEPNGIETPADALAGARDILAERISDDPTAREKMRSFFRTRATLSSKLLKSKEKEAAKFKDYFEWSEPLAQAPSHRILALRRGEKEGFLVVRIQPPTDEALEILKPLFVTGTSKASREVEAAVEDSYDRLLSSAIEVDMRLESKKRADEQAISVFVENIRELLLASPLGQKCVMAIDPGFRSGCKVVILDPQGKLLTNCVIYPDKSDFERREAAEVIHKLCTHFKVQAIAIGNGTAGRETEAFVRAIKLPASILVAMVNESGASIYSASEVAREEFPDHDLTVRGSVSIGRRLMDPLAELVKIDPKSIGVGQYQHDVDQSALKRSLDDTVMSCVNGVGVEVNTASKQLLTYVSGLGPSLAESIVTYRNEHGPFKSRKELLKVPRLGEKAFEQAAGFLRVRGGLNPLDASAVHPESYSIVESMAKDLKCKTTDLLGDEDLRRKIKLETYVSDQFGLPTLKDILSELAKPGRDPRAKFEVFEFAKGVSEVSHLQPGMKLPGIVTNVTDFGAFVDIGVHQDGLVHISQLSDTFVKNPGDVVKVQDKVMATVMEVDQDRKRIALSLKTNPQIGASSKGGKAKGRTSTDRPAPRRESSSSQGLNSLGGGLFADALSKAVKK